MDLKKQTSRWTGYRKAQWPIENHTLILMYILLFAARFNCQDLSINEETKNNTVDINKSDCHSTESSNINVLVSDKAPSTLQDFIRSLENVTEKEALLNKTMGYVENLIDNVLNYERIKIIDGVEIKIKNDTKVVDKERKENNDIEEARGLFSKYTYEYRLYQKIKSFIDTHVLSISLPKAAKFMGFRSFGLNKFFLPLLIGGQVLIKTILFAMFLPSILGSFGKILGKGISHLSATSSQASYPPANMDDTNAYNNDNKDFMGYETNPTGTYAYPQDYATEGNDMEPGNIDMSRYGAGGPKVTYLPSKNSYYKNQMSTANNYKIFQKIPASSMILSNYDPFYSPLLSRLDGIFARLGLAPSENAVTDSPQMGGQSLSDMKLEACREQLICLMYANPAKYAPYSNLVSAQLSRELNELRRPVSDNPEILRFFKYMRAARRGQEGVDCVTLHPGCSTSTPTHTMIAAYHDINKLVTARKLRL
ncbi:uncharacterized protein LOC101743499 [Bombyx mori]|uniref:Uncharacterized protein n=1 Tax=Bombyx mori TaxID=7091 RepID=A0A8R2DLD7_BOMMO|nr:uncharacterized protein LOC101743499 [Bombyx mori]XP_021203623.1 uncharacterized protein LOC101743499 [Bombyx mori]